MYWCLTANKALSLAAPSHRAAFLASTTAWVRPRPPVRWPGRAANSSCSTAKKHTPSVYTLTVGVTEVPLAAIIFSKLSLNNFRDDPEDCTSIM